MQQLAPFRVALFTAAVIETAVMFRIMKLASVLPPVLELISVLLQGYNGW